jgi:hypothetical protein
LYRYNQGGSIFSPGPGCGGGGGGVDSPGGDGLGNMSG